jgi:hypothetical protein
MVHLDQSKCPSPFLPRPPGRRASKVLLLPAARHRPPARTPAPVPFLGILALLARLLSRTPRTRPRGTGTRTAEQCSRSCTASAKCIAKPTRRFPHTRVCDAPRTALVVAPPSGAAASPQRAAPCTPHRSYMTSRDMHRTCAAAPTRPERARCSHEGIDAQPAHGQVSGAQGLQRGIDRRREVRGRKKSLCTHKHRAARPTASPRAYTASQKTAVPPRARP